MAVVIRSVIANVNTPEEIEAFKKDIVEVHKKYAKDNIDWCIKLIHVDDATEIVIRGDGSGDENH